MVEQNNFIIRQLWFTDVINGEEVILRHVSALEYLQMFVGYMREKEIDVYAKTKGIYDNINYHIVDTFDGIDYIRHGNVLCSPFNQAINDMFAGKVEECPDCGKFAVREAIKKEKEEYEKYRKEREE